MEKSNILDTRIRDLNLSTRAINCLARANLRTVKEVLIRFAGDDSELYRVRNLGSKSAEEIKEIIIAFGKEIGADLYVGMPLEEVEHFGLSESEIVQYEEEKRLKNVKKEQRELFLSTPLARLDISNSYFNDFSFSVRTLGEMLYLLADKKLYDRIENLDRLKDEIDALGLPNIYFGMSQGEIDNIYVSDEILSLLSLVIQSAIIRKNGRMDEEARKAKERIQESISSILSATERAKKRSESIMADLERSKELASELEGILQEQSNLERQSKELDSRIGKLLVKANGKPKKF